MSFRNSNMVRGKTKPQKLMKHLEKRDFGR